MTDQTVHEELRAHPMHAIKTNEAKQAANESAHRIDLTCGSYGGSAQAWLGAKLPTIKQEPSTSSIDDRITPGRKKRSSVPASAISSHSDDIVMTTTTHSRKRAKDGRSPWTEEELDKNPSLINCPSLLSSHGVSTNSIGSDVESLI